MDLPTYSLSTEESHYPTVENLNSGNSSSSPTMTERLLLLAINVDHLYTPVLCLFGTIGNLLSIVVFFNNSNKARGSLSSSVYLSALAISDTGFLINLFIMWLESMGTNLLEYSFMCKGVMYMAQVTGFLSVWFIVAFTVERFFAICYPLSKPSKCTASRAKRISIFLSIFALIFFSYVLIIAETLAFPPIPQDLNSSSSETQFVRLSPHESLLPTQMDEYQIKMENLSYLSPSGSDSFTQVPITPPMESGSEARKEEEGGSVYEPGTTLYMCTVPNKYHTISMINSYIDSILTFILPFSLLGVLNLKIIFCVRQIQRHRESMIASNKVSHRLQQRQPISCSERRETSRDSSSIAFRPIKMSGGTKKRKRKREKPKLACTTANCPNGSIEKKDVRGSSSIECDDQNSPETPPFKPSPAPSRHNKTEIRVTKTLLLVSSIFLLLHLPSHSIRTVAFIKSQSRDIGPSESLQLNVAQHWANLLFNTNFGINFLLYCCSGKAFRHSIKILFSRDFFTRRRRTWNPRYGSSTAGTTNFTLHTENTPAASRKYNSRIPHADNCTSFSLTNEDEDQV